jgi:hypothetical protein
MSSVVRPRDWDHTVNRVIRYEQNGKTCGPFLFLVDPANPTVLWWGEQAGYFELSLQYQEILEEWPYHDYDAELKFQQKYRRDAYKPAEPTISSAWIDREGRFYPVEFWEHSEAAKTLAYVLFSSSDGSNKLREQGWIRLSDGTVNLGDFNGIVRPTEAQVNTLETIVLLPAETDRERGFVHDLRRFVKSMRYFAGLEDD